MSYRVVILGSGSKGNSLLLANRRVRLLVDMGFSQRRATTDLAAENIDPRSIKALFVTHTHGDHIGDPAVKFAWRNGIPLVSARENLDVLHRRYRPVMGRLERAGLVREIPPKGFNLDGVDVRPFAVPHDAEGVTLGYHFTLGDGNGADPLRMAVATDLGHVPPEVMRVLEQSDVLVLESNHDMRMLENSGRPLALIDRIRGECGHLSNDQTAAVVGEIVSKCGPTGPRRVVLAHLSEECNTAQSALTATRRMVKEAVGQSRPPRVVAAVQHAALTVLSGR